MLYEINNKGIRPAYLKEIVTYSIDKEYHIGKPDTVKDNRLLTIGNPASRRIKIYSKAKILEFNDTYIVFIITYYDPFLGKNFNMKQRPFIFKWTKVTEDELPYTFAKTEVDNYYAFQSCSEAEERKILNALKK